MALRINTLAPVIAVILARAIFQGEAVHVVCLSRDARARRHAYPSPETRRGTQVSLRCLKARHLCTLQSLHVRSQALMAQ